MVISSLLKQICSHDAESLAIVNVLDFAASEIYLIIGLEFDTVGSPTKTEMVDEAGGRRQIAQLSTAAIVLLVQLFLTKPLSFLPSPVLSAIVFHDRPSAP